MSAPTTSISGGELASLIVAITGVGYFIVNIVRKPSTSDPKLLKRLLECQREKGRQSAQLEALRARIRSLEI